MSDTVKDIIALVILLAIMLFFVKGLPALMGGAQDANGNPLTISTSIVYELPAE
ncbi:MAG: hypothetical protein IJ720_05760 [Clostridia bacterium]|nr:hypothetical protein [Clostridia bacterium]MBQ8469099.1 hypothetical protein [Clostridia bacterium]MBR1704852.1 hypothetical protein [Clostridia bacterium]